MFLGGARFIVEQKLWWYDSPSTKSALLVLIAFEGQIVVRSTDNSLSSKFLAYDELQKSQKHAYDGVDAQHEYRVLSPVENTDTDIAKQERIATGCSDDEEDDEAPMEALPVGPEDTSGPVVAAASNDGSSAHGTVSSSETIDAFCLNCVLTCRSEHQCSNLPVRFTNVCAHGLCMQYVM